MSDDSEVDDHTAARIARVEEIIRAVEKGEMTVGEGKEALTEARELIEEMQSEFDEEGAGDGDSPAGEDS
jgi:polyhydroxyalkanoate synthesis regulator phasin